jgi:hypothetical protein
MPADGPKAKRFFRDGACPRLGHQAVAGVLTVACKISQVDR